MQELVWVSLADMTERVSRAAVRDAIKTAGGHGSWDLKRAPVLDNVKVRAGIARWRDGARWEDTGIYEFTMDLIDRHGVHDGLRTIEDVVERYRKLDQIWHQVRTEGRLRPMSELDPANVTEKDGMSVAVGRDGDVLWVSDGSHRIAMGLSAGLDRLPARLVLVHPSARRNDDVVWSRDSSRPRDTAPSGPVGLLGSLLAGSRAAVFRR